MPRPNKSKPNPEWVSAAYELAGFSNIVCLAAAIESTLKLTRGGPLSIHVEGLEGAVQWKITQIIE